MAKKVIFLIIFGATFTFSSSLEVEELVAKCVPNVYPTTMKSLINVESTGNPFAIAIVKGSKTGTATKNLYRCHNCRRFFNPKRSEFFHWDRSN